MSRNPKGTVGIESFQGMLRLRLPRTIFEGGKQERICLGLPDTPQNWQIAEAKAKLIEAEIVLGQFDPTLKRYKQQSKYQVSEEIDFLDLWRQYTESRISLLAASTIKKEFRRVERRLESISPKQRANAKALRAYLIKNLKPDAARRIIKYLKACCQWAENEEIVKTNPFANLKTPSSVKHRKINPFTKGERDLIIKTFAEDRYYSFYTSYVKFLFYTGCRPEEAIALQWNHVDVKNFSYITFSETVVDRDKKGTKTHRIRRFPINQAVKDLLLEVMPQELNPDGLVFPSPKGLNIDPHNFLNRAWRTVLSKLPIPYRPQYNARHSFITWCLEQGVGVVQVAEWVGNSPTIIYSNYAGLISTVQVPEP